jgi:hypothetical protein
MPPPTAARHATTLDHDYAPRSIEVRFLGGTNVITCLNTGSSMLLDLITWSVGATLLYWCVKLAVRHALDEREGPTPTKTWNGP